MKNIFVFGSINYDLVMSSPHMPKKGETVKGDNFFTNSGGKGANQAVACSKLGGNTFMLGATGADAFGTECKNALKAYGVNTGFVQTVENCATGTAVIILAECDNRIIIAGGANVSFDKEKRYGVINKNVKRGDIFICQLEISAECVAKGFEIAKSNGALTILNPAPAQKIGVEILKHTDIIIPNETEAEVITGESAGCINGLKNAGKYFKAFGVSEAVITLGSRGCYYNGKIYPAHKADKVVDTTAAGDTFIGALAGRLAAGLDIAGSLDFCQKACALKVARRGAQIAIPTLAEVLGRS